MKLYATTKGKATKGQGSNTDLLTIFIAEIDGQRQEIAYLDMIAKENYYIIDYKLPDGKSGAIKLSNTKGKSQKGEKCKICDDDFYNGHQCI